MPRTRGRRPIPRRESKLLDGDGVFALRARERAWHGGRSDEGPVSLARSLGRHALVYGAGVMLQRVAGFVMLPLYSRRLTTADYGEIGVIDVTVGLVALVVGLNLAEALIRIYNEDETEDARRASVATTVLANGALALVATLVLCLAAKPLGPLIFGAPVRPRLVVLAAATMGLDAIAAPCFAYLRILLASRLFVLTSLARLTIAVVTNLVWLGWWKGGMTAYFASGAIASLAQAAFLLTWTFRRVPLTIAFGSLARLLRFSLPLVPASVCSLVLHQSSRWVLARFGAFEALGVFMVAYQFGNVVSNGVIQPFNLIWSAKVYEVLKLPGGRETVGRVFLWFAVVLVWAAVALSLLAPPVIVMGYVGPSFVLAARSIPLVAFAYVLFGLGFVVHVGVFMAKRTEMSLVAASRAAIVSVVLNLVGAAFVPWEWLDLVPGVAGVVSFLVLAFFRYRFAQTLYPIPYPWERAGLVTLLGMLVVALPTVAGLGFAGDLGLRALLALTFPLLALPLLPRLEIDALRVSLAGAVLAR
jgi:O-antigen/teichoic acid export membrane protein